MPLIQLLALRNINGRDEPLLAKDYNISNTLEEELKMIQEGEKTNEEGEVLVLQASRPQQIQGPSVFKI